MTGLVSPRRSSVDPPLPEALAAETLVAETPAARAGDQDVREEKAGEEEAWDYETIDIDDDEPVDSLISEKQQRLSVNSAYSSYAPGVPFLVAANVGVFYGRHQPPLVPDVMLSLNVQVPEDWRDKKNRSYFIPVLGKPPDLAIEIVSNKKGHELGRKLIDYAQVGILYYVVFDPLKLLSEEVIQAFELPLQPPIKPSIRPSTQPSTRRSRRAIAPAYRRLENPWFERLQLGLCLWEGPFEQKVYPWLRWCDGAGQVLLTGDERAALETQRRDLEAQRADQAEQAAQTERQRAEEAEQAAQAERQRAEEAEQQMATERSRARAAEGRERRQQQRAEAERQRAEAERQRAEQAERLARELAERLRALEAGQPPA